MEIIPLLIFALAITGGLGYAIGHLKGRGSEGFLLGLFLGPLGWLLILLFPEEGRRCPECKGVIPAGARRCKHCAYVFSQPVVNYEPNGNTQRAYYVQHGEKTEGPFTVRQLKLLVADGNLPPDALCARKGDADWYPVSIVIE